VVVHGDHGAGETWRDGRLVPDETAYARTLLLVKAGAARGALRQAEEAARIADVAPTLLAVLGLPGDRRLDGRVLEEALSRLSADPPLSAGSGARR
jgi:bisphosphoglycerate-independent phosphoglycerate mutase (AlkP superfamily)